MPARGIPVNQAACSLRELVDKRRRRRGGGFAIVVGLSLTVLISFAALAIDVSYLRLVDAQVQNATDAAAHAGVSQLDGTDEGLDLARSAAIEVAAMNLVAGDPLVLTDDQVVFGVWDTDVGTFTASDDPSEVNALDIQGSVADVSALVRGAAGWTGTVGASAATTAMQFWDGASEVDCYLPVVLPICLMDEYGTEEIMEVDLVFAPSTADNVGWGRGEGTPNANFVKSQVADCTQDGPLSTDDTVGMHEGVTTPGFKAIESAIEGSTTTWDTSTWGSLPEPMEGSTVASSAYGNTLEGPIPIVQHCDDSSFTGTAEVEGFTWAVIFDVVAKGSASEKNIRVRIDTQNLHDFGTEIGGTDYGVQAATAVIVR